jgi:hypothetical protein
MQLTIRNVVLLNDAAGLTGGSFALPFSWTDAATGSPLRFDPVKPGPPRS